MLAEERSHRARRPVCNIIAQHSGQPFEKVAADGERDYWMTAEEALAYGMVDEILRKKAR